MRKLLLPLVLLVGCAIRREDPEPKDMTLQVKFPSVAAAATVNDIEISVYDAEGQADACATLMAARASGAAASLPLVTSGRSSVCAYYRNSAAIADVTMGQRAFVAVASFKDVELFSGCVLQTIGDTTSAVLPITLSRSGDLDLVLNEGSCSSLQTLCTTNECGEPF